MFDWHPLRRPLDRYWYSQTGSGHRIRTDKTRWRARGGGWGGAAITIISNALSRWGYSGYLGATFANQQTLGFQVWGYWGYLGATFANQQILVFQALGLLGLSWGYLMPTSKPLGFGLWGYWGYLGSTFAN